MDVDIDLPSTTDPLEIFPNWVKASVLKDGYLQPHPCGVYPSNIPVDNITNLAAIPYDKAEELGYDKLDMLHLSVYDVFSSREEIVKLLQIEPNWQLLEIQSVVEKLFQISKHFSVVQQLKPKSIEDLADLIALIRPGKRSLIPLYLRDKPLGRKLLYSPDKEGYYFKKSHSFAYALVIVLQLHLI